MALVYTPPAVPDATFEVDGRVYKPGETIEVDDARAKELLAGYPRVLRSTVVAKAPERLPSLPEKTPARAPEKTDNVAEPSGIAHTSHPKAGGRA